MYGWRYEGITEDDKHYCYFWNDGNIVESKFFSTEEQAMAFISKWKNRIQNIDNE